MSDSLKLLDGYTVLDFTDLRGQFCGKCLSDLGATVIKIEPPSGDAVRRMAPFKDDIAGDDRSLRFAFMNSGKMSLTIDVEQPEGREAFLRLVNLADVLLESGTPGDLERLGLGPSLLSERNPRLVITSISGFGQTGPYSNFAAPHAVSFAMSGLMYLAGEPTSAPVLPPEYQGFYYSNLHAAFGTLLALWRREESGVGQEVDVSVQETLATQEHILRIFGSLGTNVTRQGSQYPFAAPASIFPTKDGFVFLFASRIHWPLLLEVWPDHPPEFAEPEWEPDIVRRGKVDLINEKVSEFTRRFGKEEFALLMQKKGIPCLQVNSPGEFARDEHIRIRGLMQEVDHPGIGRCEQVSFPVLIDGQRVPIRPAPKLGEHNSLLLGKKLGLSGAQQQSLVAGE